VGRNEALVTELALRRNTRHRPRGHLLASAPGVLRQHAIQWQDTRIPLVGNLRAVGWLPTVLVAACAAALMHLLQTSGVATTGYDIQRLQAERSDWTLRNEQLTLELAKLESLAWIESEAVGRLRMVKPEQVVHLRIDESGR
jgi:hypothetical protein